MGLCICLALAVCFGIEAFDVAGRDASLWMGEQINPNEASVASLARLPGIGLSRAHAIVVYREQRRLQVSEKSVFMSVDDLQQVKGIGPAVIEGVRPWLCFEASPENGSLSRTNAPSR